MDISDDQEFEFRTLRIGTCKAFPADEPGGYKEPMIMNESGFKCKVSKTQGKLGA